MRRSCLFFVALFIFASCSKSKLGKSAVKFNSIPTGAAGCWGPAGSRAVVLNASVNSLLDQSNKSISLFFVPKNLSSYHTGGFRAVSTSVFSDGIPNPFAKLFEGSQEIDSNDNFASGNAPASLRNGLSTNESAFVTASLHGEQGYTLAVTPSGTTSSVGRAMGQVYDMSTTKCGLKKSVARGFVSPGNNVVMGIILSKGVTSPHSYLIRATTTGAGGLDNAKLEIIDGTGNTVRTSDNWDNTLTEDEKDRINAVGLGSTLFERANDPVAFLSGESQDLTRTAPRADTAYTINVSSETAGASGGLLIELYDVSLTNADN